MLNSHHITGVLLHTLVHTHTQKTLNSTNYKVFASFSRLARVQNIVRSSKGAQFSICFWKGHERDIPLVFISSYPKSSVNDRWTMASSLHCSSPYCRSSSPSGVLWLFLFVGKVPLTLPHLSTRRGQESCTQSKAWVMHCQRQVGPKMYMNVSLSNWDESHHLMFPKCCAFLKIEMKYSNLAFSFCEAPGGPTRQIVHKQERYINLILFVILSVTFLLVTLYIYIYI